jgi:hypothetical protein
MQSTGSLSRSMTSSHVWAPSAVWTSSPNWSGWWEPASTVRLSRVGAGSESWNSCVC